VRWSVQSVRGQRQRRAAEFAMTVTQTQRELLARVEALRAALADAPDAGARQRLGERTKQEILRISKAFKRRIDQRALHSVYDRHWFAVNERESLGQALERATEKALAAVENAVGGGSDTGPEAEAELRREEQ